MSEPQDLRSATDDYALDRVPDQDRHGWLNLSWNTVGIVTGLVSLFVGALITFSVGMTEAVIAGIIVAGIGGTLGAGVGHVAFKSGLSSSVLARYHGFGLKGSVVVSAIFGFMIIGFIGLENLLLYHGFLFYFSLDDTLLNQIVIYGLLTIAWIVLTAFGFDIVTRFSSMMVIAFLGVLAYMMIDIVLQSQQPLGKVLTFGQQFSEESMVALGVTDFWDKVIFCVNILIGSAGALALIDADLGRYAKRSRDIAIAAYAGSFFIDVVLIIAGGVIMYAGMPALVDYYVQTQGLTPEIARSTALESPESVAFAFIVFGGAIGAFLMVASQSKVQVLNTYSSALSLTNLSDAVFSWRPGRIFFVVGANLLGMIFVATSVEKWLGDFLVILGILTTCLAGIMIADYFIVRPRMGQEDITVHTMDKVNWAGVVSLVVGFVIAHYGLNNVIKLEFFTALFFSFGAYPLLRMYLLKPRYMS